MVGLSRDTFPTGEGGAILRKKESGEGRTTYDGCGKTLLMKSAKGGKAECGGGGKTIPECIIGGLLFRRDKAHKHHFEKAAWEGNGIKCAHLRSGEERKT